MDEMLTVAEIAPLLKVKQRRVYQLLNDGYVPCVRRGSRMYVPRQAFERWWEAQSLTALAGVRQRAPKAGSNAPH
jgi:excisionase family DNA binding protein